MGHHQEGRAGSRAIRKVAVAALLLAGCASNPPITAAGSGTYLISKQSGNAFAGMAGLHAEALHEAGEHCASQRRELHVVDTHEAQPPFILGNYPRVDIQFRCE